jgi:hypothetical protein
VLQVEPYKGEHLPYWRFKTVTEAQKSPATIYRIFLTYLKAGDFPGADMARKFLQMGWTRARRYANHRGGRKYDQRTGEELPRTEDKEKAERRRFVVNPMRPPGVTSAAASPRTSSPA